ncbi:MAG: hypothetical protein WAT84_00270 [Candidatus Moraniibacteriota bacterium]
MPNPMWEKIKPTVIQLVLFGTIGLVGWFGIRLLLSTIQTKMDDIQKHAVTREHREKQLERLPELEAQHALIAEHVGSLGIILTKDRLVEFIERLEHLAGEEGVAIEIESRDNAFLESKITATEKKTGTAKPAVADEGKAEDAAEPSAKKASPTSKETGLVAELPLKKYLKLTITVTGAYGDIVRYLSRLESLPYALDIIGMNIKAQLDEVDRVAPESGALDPFGVPLTEPATRPHPDTLNAVFETVVYMKD